MSVALRCAAAVAAILMSVAPVSAQDVPPSDPGYASETAAGERSFAEAIGPTAAGVALMAPLTFGSTRTTRAAFALQERASHDVALMIVGGAALVVGALVEGDAGTVIMIGGGAAAVIGLYRYLT